ncbi:hypothetical protein [Flavobacterium sp.]|uniref:hypothetical protein n=1 Tax=Flavobacterium sp. TaxID=239 RepID=UPI003F6A0987
MKYICFLFLSFSVLSQENRIQVIDYSNLKPVIDVELFYKNKLIGKTDSLGNFKTLDNLKSILLVKENYYDTIINLKNPVIKIKKIEGIILKEIVLSELSNKSILDSVYQKISKLKNYNIPNNFHFKNLSKMNNDTLCFFNKIIHFKKGLGFFTNSNSNIIKKFNTDKFNTIYKLNNKSIIFNIDYLHSNLPYFSIELQLITKFQKYFDYSIKKEEGFFIIQFKPKNKRNEYPYEGVLIVDPIDYGIYEFEFKTINNSKRNLMFNDEIINFKIISENSKLINKKDENGIYELVQYKFFSKLEILDGFFKGSIFENNCYKETTIVDSSDINNSKKIDFSTYNIE